MSRHHRRLLYGYDHHGNRGMLRQLETGAAQEHSGVCVMSPGPDNQQVGGYGIPGSSSEHH